MAEVYSAEKDILDQLSQEFILGKLNRSEVDINYIISKFNLDQSSADVILKEFKNTCIDCRESYTKPQPKPKQVISEEEIMNSDAFYSDQGEM
jgi:hypothetical protein